MRKISVVFLAALLGMFMVVGVASASLIGATLGNPRIFSGNTTYNYYAERDLFSMSRTGLSITFDGITSVDIRGGYSANFYVDNNGDFVGGVDGEDDLQIWGNFTYEDKNYEGLLLAGEVNNFGWFDPTGPGVVFDFTFDIVGGALSEFYPDGIGGDYFMSLTSNFGGWTTDHWNNNSFGTSGRVVNPVPEPASMLLLGTGLLGLVGFGKRKIKKS